MLKNNDIQQTGIQSELNELLLQRQASETSDLKNERRQYVVSGLLLLPMQDFQVGVSSL
jgi:hypothetical protein